MAATNLRVAKSNGRRGTVPTTIFLRYAGGFGTHKIGEHTLGGRRTV